MSARELRQLIVSKQISPVEATQDALKKASEAQPVLNAFCQLQEESALAAAHDAEQALMDGRPLGALHGIPVSVKDLIAVKGMRLAFGSHIMADNIAEEDAPSVARLRAAGAIIIGKTTTSEFGCKPVGDSPLTGITRHPWNLAKTPGGSSAGAAASVAAGITPLALGTDGGGSLRIPAALTGSFAIKPQFGRVPVWPTSATPTLAHVGPIASNVKDAALMLQVIAGYDSRDPFAVAAPVPDFLAACEMPLQGLRAAWSPDLGYARPDAEVAAITGKAALQFANLGLEMEEVDDVIDDPAAIWMAEFYAGVGTRLRHHLAERRASLDPAVASMIEAALARSLQDYYDTVFERYALREKLRRFFERYDILLTPTLPISSLDAGRNIPATLPERGLLDWVFYTYPFNLTGQPAATICAGIASDGMPVGLQIIGRALAETDVLRVAAAFERSQPPGYNSRPAPFFNS